MSAQKIKTKQPLDPQIEKLLNVLLNEYPGAYLDDLRRRLNSNDQATFLGAFNELIAYALLKRLGCSITLNAPADGEESSPDFSLQTRQGPVCVEVTVLHEIDGARSGERRRIEQVQPVIDRVYVKSRLRPISICICMAGENTLSASKLKEKLPRVIQEMIDGKLPYKAFEMEDWRFCIRSLQASPPGCPVSSKCRWAGYAPTEYMQRLRKRLVKELATKRKQCRGASGNYPSILVINILKPCITEPKCLELFYGLPDDGVCRAKNFDSYSEYELELQAISKDLWGHSDDCLAILILPNLGPNSLPFRVPFVFYNPFVDSSHPTVKELRASPFGGLRSYLPVSRGGRQMLRMEPAQKTLYNIFLELDSYARNLWARDFHFVGDQLF